MPKADYLGVFSTRGTPAEPGGRKVDGQRKQYWFVWQDSIAKAYLAQALDASYLPQGQPRLLPSEVFRQSFTREPRARATPTMQPDVADYLDKVFVRGPRRPEESTLVSGPSGKRAAATSGAVRDAEPSPFLRPKDIQSPPPERSRDKGGFATIEDAPLPPSTAEELDRSLRAQFAMTVMRFRRGNTDGALREFRRMVAVADGIVPAHKHMFTDFGVDLRKSHLYDLALSSFRRALDLSPDDSHALFNVGRALYEVGKYKEADEHLARALTLEPDLACARRLREEIRVRIDTFIPQEF